MPFSYCALRPFQWRYQRFNRGEKNIKSFNETDLNKVREWLRQLPKNAKMGRVSLGFTQPKQNDLQKKDLNDRVRLQSIKTWILEKGKQYLLQGFDDDIIDQLIANPNPMYE